MKHKTQNAKHEQTIDGGCDYIHPYMLIVNTDGTFNVLTYQAKLDSHEDAKPED